MNILLTGATGFVGKNLIPTLQKDGHEVFVIVRPTTDISKIKLDNIFVFDGNVNDLAAYMREKSIDGIIHLASLYINKHEPNQINDLINSNITFGTFLIQAACQSGVKWFLNTGTIWQNYNVPPYSKQYCPVNLYAATKQAFIDIAKFYTETSDLRFCTLKLCDTYGPNDTRRKIYSLFEENSKSSDILRMSPGEQKIDLVHIDCVVEKFLLLAQKLNENKVLDSEYVVSSGVHKSLRQLAADFEHEHHVKLHIEWGGLPYRQREVMIPYIGTRLFNDE